MKRLIAAVAVTLLSTLPASAADYMAGSIMIDGPVARASAGNAKNSAAFMTLMNTGADDRLVAARSGIAARTELHTHTVDSEGVARMRAVEDIPLPANETVTLKPGGLHVMFMNLNAPLKKGDSFELTLTFEKAGEVTIEVPVGDVAAMGKGGGMQHGHGAKMKH